MTAPELPLFLFLRVVPSPQGWTNNQIFTEWFHRIFLPFVQDRNKTGAPILLIIDGHALHETTKMQWLCYTASPPVILYCLPTKTTHRLQPLDVGVFGPLQNEWAKHTQACAAQNNSITIGTVIEEYMQVRKMSMSLKIIQGAFRHCSIYPFNPQIFKKGNYAPSRMTSTSSITPPSYPAEVPSSPSATVMTDTDTSDPTYHGSSDMGGSGAEDDNNTGEIDRDGDGDGDGHVRAVSSLFFFAAHRH